MTETTRGNNAMMMASSLSIATGSVSATCYVAGPVPTCACPGKGCVRESGSFAEETKPCERSAHGSLLACSCPWTRGPYPSSRHPLPLLMLCARCPTVPAPHHHHYRAFAAVAAERTKAARRP